MTIPNVIEALEECEQLLATIQEALRRLATEAISPPAWRKSSNHYEEPCIGSAFEKTGRRFSALYMGGYFIDLDELYNKLPKEDKVSDEVDDMLQKEQKPVEDKAFAEWIEDYWSHNKVNNPYSCNKGEEIQFDHRGFISFCEAYCYSRKPVLHDTFGYEEGRQAGRNEGVKLVLNEPDKYGLCKPSEWSEKDERILKGIIGLVDHDQHYGVSNKEMIAWLKSLRPSWKPSEEQIRALERAIIRVHSVDDIPILTELRDKLKKL